MEDRRKNKASADAPKRRYEDVKVKSATAADRIEQATTAVIAAFRTLEAEDKKTEAA